MILKVEKQKDYELLDAGVGAKLERYGAYTLVRPDPEALWQRGLEESVWDSAHLEFERKGNSGKWETRGDVPKSWNISFGDLTFLIKPTSFKHIGLFPEQLPNWQWMQELVQATAGARVFRGPRVSPVAALTPPDHQKTFAPASAQISILNLFAYTGGATLACAKAGAEVTHVDGSKAAVSWARENAKLSGLENAPVHWIVEDCIKFLRREVKRGHTYDAIIMDPPSFGHGPKDELWKIEEDFSELMDLCKQILSKNPLFVLINGYTAGYSAIAYENCLKDMTKGHGGAIESGELVITESKGDKALPCGIFARWQK